MKTNDMSPESDYRLVNTETRVPEGKFVKLSSSEAWTLNYAFAVNGKPQRYLKVDEFNALTI